MIGMDGLCVRRRLAAGVGQVKSVMDMAGRFFYPLQCQAGGKHSKKTVRVCEYSYNFV